MSNTCINFVWFFSSQVLFNIVYGIVYGVAALGLCYIVFRYLFGNINMTLIDCYPPVKRSWLCLFKGMLLGIICFSITIAILCLTGQYQLVFIAFDIPLLLAVLVKFIGIGVIEELCTRGLMQHALMRFGNWPSLLIVSILFGLLHLANPGVSFNAIMGVTMAGLVMGMAMYATRSIMFSIGFHITWNWVQGSIFGVSVSGTGSEGNIFAAEPVGKNTLFTGGDFGAEASLACLVVLALTVLVLFMYGKRKGNLKV